MTGALRRLGVGLLDVLLPPQCVCCDARVIGQGQLCADCFGRLNFITAPYCLRCGVPFPARGQGGPDGLCPGCRDNPPLFVQARAALRYDTQGRRLILPFKHGGRTELAESLGAHMARAGRDLMAEAAVLVPVPLHRRRLFQRKYNQAALLAHVLGRLSGVPVLPDALVRIRPTPSLDDRSAAERAEIVAGAFAVRPRRAAGIAGRRVLVVDDVMTSGATTNACAGALLRAGAKAVDVLAAARVPDPRIG